MKKNCQYVIAPTADPIREGRSILRLPDGKLMIHPNHGMALDEISHVHIYILSDDEPKVGDWVYDSIPDEDEYSMFQVDSIVKASGICRSKKSWLPKTQEFTTTLDSCRRIIATTNMNLMVEYDFNAGHSGATCDVRSFHSLPSITTSDLEYIVSLHNGKGKMKKADVEKLADDYRTRHPGGNSDIMLAFEDGYRKCMQDNSGKFDELIGWIDNVKHGEQPDVRYAFDQFKKQIQSIREVQQKIDMVAVECENICIQTGMPCGMPCFGDCDKISVKRPKFNNGSIVIVRD